MKKLFNGIIKKCQALYDAYYDNVSNEMGLIMGILAIPIMVITCVASIVIYILCVLNYAIEKFQHLLKKTN